MCTDGQRERKTYKTYVQIDRKKERKISFDSFRVDTPDAKVIQNRRSNIWNVFLTLKNFFLNFFLKKKITTIFFEFEK